MDLNIVISLIIIVIVLFIINKIPIDKYLDKLSKNKSFISASKKIKEFLGGSLTFIFFITLFWGIIVNMIKPDTFPEMTLQLSVVGLTLGAFSIGIATLISQIKNNGISDEIVRYRHLAEDFITGGIYFIFAYFFWLVLNIENKEGSQFIEIMLKSYSVLASIAVIGGVIYLIKAMWCLLKENL